VILLFLLCILLELLDFFIVDQLHILYASLLLLPVTVSFVPSTILYRRVPRLLPHDLGILCMVRAHFNSILSIGPAAGPLTIHVFARIIVA
jgi:hypothetical protein